jgi:uncharacterized membrane protein YfcA
MTGSAHMTATTYLFLACAGFFAGLVDSLAGGGGLISLPALLAAGVPPHIALGTNKVQSCLGTSVGVVRYLKRGLIQPSIAVPAAIASLVGSIGGARVVLLIPSDKLMMLIPPLIIVVAVITFFKRQFGNEDYFTKASRRDQAMAVVVGGAIGFYDGFFGPGTGTFLVFLFVLVFKFGFLRANANAKLVNFGSNISALISFALAGKVMLLPALIMACCNIAGNYIGSGLAIKKGATLIKPVFGLVLAGLMIKILFFS